MNRVFLLVAFLGVVVMNGVQAQETPDTATKKEPIIAIMPKFPGGDEARVKFMAENLLYPIEARKNGWQGRAMVGFAVEPDGSITNVTITKSSGYPILDQEAIRVVKSMPNWKPGEEIGGKTVRVLFQVPVTFAFNEKQSKSKKKKEKPYIMVEKMPEYPGGDEARVKFLQDNLRYPLEAMDKGWQGRAMVSFIVEPDGSITNIEIAKSSGYTVLDEEAIRIVTLMPNWKPGYYEGKAIRVQFQVPITFGEDKKK